MSADYLGIMLKGPLVVNRVLMPKAYLSLTRTLTDLSREDGGVDRVQSPHLRELIQSIDPESGKYDSAKFDRIARDFVTRFVNFWDNAEDSYVICRTFEHNRFKVVAFGEWSWGDTPDGPFSLMADAVLLNVVESLFGMDY